MNEDGSLPVKIPVDEDKVFKLQSPDKVGSLPKRKEVEVKIFDNVSKFRYAIRAYEFRGAAMFCADPSWPEPGLWESFWWWIRGGRRRGRLYIAPMLWKDRWYNFKLYCLAIRFRITDKLGLTHP